MTRKAQTRAKAGGGTCPGRVLGGFVLVEDPEVKLREEEARSEGGIVIPRTAQRPPTCAARVLDAGPEAQAEGIVPGCDVLFAPFAGARLTLEGAASMLFLRVEDVIAVFPRPTMPKTKKKG